MGRRHGRCDGSERPRRKNPLGRLAFWTCVGLSAAAVVQELRKPAGERTWTGKVGGLVPYDLRWPVTADRVRQSVWNTASDDLITPHAFGVGWSINFAKVAQIGQEAAEAARR